MKATTLVTRATAVRQRLASLLEERAAVMSALRKSGQTLGAIGELFGVSGERVRQVLSRKEQR